MTTVNGMDILERAAVNAPLSFPCQIGRTFIFEAKDSDDYNYILSNSLKIEDNSMIAELKQGIEDEFGIKLLQVDDVKL